MSSQLRARSEPDVLAAITRRATQGVWTRRTGVSAGLATRLHQRDIRIDRQANANRTGHAGEKPGEPSP
jgi:hypothetical protein